MSIIKIRKVSYDGIKMSFSYESQKNIRICPCNMFVKNSSIQ